MGNPTPKDDSTTQGSSLKDPHRKKKKKKKKEKKKSKEEKQSSAETNQSKVESTSQESHAAEPINSENDTTKSQQSKPTTSIESTIQTPPPPGSHPFEVDDSDHCETPLRAYQDIAFLLDQLLQNNNKVNRKRSRSSFRIYDPYYCDGGVKVKLASLGFTNVINENRDFYKDIANNQIPDHDILVTNPPYSGEHMEKILDFCRKNQKPSFLLLPHFVYTKDYYSRALGSFARDFCFLVPSIRYSYIPPAWVQPKTGSKALARGKDQTAPFPSFWYACHLQKTSISKEWLANTFGPSGSVRSQHTASGLRYAAIPAQIPRDFKGEFDPTKKRPNPRARKRMRMAAAAAANGTSVQPKQQQRQRQRDPKKKKKRRY